MPDTILVVEDDPDIARFIEISLDSVGYEVIVVGSGEEALQVAKGIRLDLVLLDLMLPRMDGFEVAKQLRHNPATASTSIVMVTAKAKSSDKIVGLDSGADDYIVKPFDPLELQARVRSALRRTRGTP